MTILQGGTYLGQTIPDKLFSFNETRRAYSSFYTTINGGWNPEMAIGAQDFNFYWKSGNMYIQNDEGSNRTFLGTAYYPSITLVFNDKIDIKKTFEALAYQGDQYWVSDTDGDILTSQPNEQTGLPQISQLKSVDYEINEGLYYAGLLRDSNSMTNTQEALVNGDFLKGVWLQVKFTYKGSNFGYLFLPYCKWDFSPRNL